MYSEKLKEYLVSNPERKVVYMNDKGGWLLHQRVEFPNEVSRDEILGEAPSKKEAPAKKEKESTNPSKK